MENNEIENSAENANIITFEDGILGFEETKKYRLYQEDENSIIWCLQSAESDIPSFIVIDPFTILKEYKPVLAKSDLHYFGETDMSNLCFLVIAVIKPQLEDSVVNLKAPIVIDIHTRKAKQIIMDNSEYPIRYQLFSSEE